MGAARPAAARRPLTRVQAGRGPLPPLRLLPRIRRLLPLISVFLYPGCPGPRQIKALCPAQPAAAPPEQLPSPLVSEGPPHARSRSACLACDCG